ncbi:MAG: hypothetical protein HN478_23735 [Rhodospirillaceae bacterium]|jgi:hypothetical protein|nr:hypothetical protein [Rhodospirillaceae bacterium]MBT4491187.1 hypothetical protein [Rhodospirillaceae bacterium]MBT5194441.1 hypothetical protein [Rhodospirillaceae bacterium]MBT6428802.1 hypothetical protein [Rhodospirillaceae bacterium]
MEAVKKAEVCDVTANQYLYDQAFPNDPDTPAFIPTYSPGSGLTDQEDSDYLKRMPEKIHGQITLIQMPVHLRCESAPKQ